jgi:hypothetical protein
MRVVGGGWGLSGAFLMWHPVKYAAMLADKMKVGPPSSRAQGVWHVFVNSHTYVGHSGWPHSTLPESAIMMQAPPPTLPTWLSQAHGTHAWLVNTGWTGGRYGVGSRISIAHIHATVYAHPTFWTQTALSFPTNLPTSPLLPPPPKTNPTHTGPRHPCFKRLVNTGWTGRRYGVGSRMSIAHPHI